MSREATSEAERGPKTLTGFYGIQNAAGSTASDVERHGDEPVTVEPLPHPDHAANLAAALGAVEDLEARMTRIAELVRASLIAMNHEEAMPPQHQDAAKAYHAEAEAKAATALRLAEATAWCPRCGETVPPRKALWCDAPACPFDAEDHE